MNLKQALKHFNTTQVGIAALLHITQPAVSNWGRRNYIPELQQMKLRELSGGVLRVSGRRLPLTAKVLARPGQER